MNDKKKGDKKYSAQEVGENVLQKFLSNFDLGVNLRDTLVRAQNNKWAQKALGELVIKEYSGNKAKGKLKDFIAEMSSNEIAGLLSVIVEQGMINEILISYVESDQEYQKILSLVRKSLEDKKVNLELKNIFVERKNRVQEKIINLTMETVELASDREKRNQMENLLQKGKENLFKRVGEDLRKSCKDAKLLERFKIIEQGSTFFASFGDFPITDEILSGEFTLHNHKGEKIDRARFLAYRIYKPDWATMLFRLEDDFQKWPFNWFMPLDESVALIESLYRLYYQNKDQFYNYLDDYYGSGSGKSKILKNLSYIPTNWDRIKFITEAFENYAEQRFASAIILLMSQIEGIIWNIAIFVDNKEIETIFPEDIVPAQNKPVITVNGKVQEDIGSVRKLIEETNLRNYFSPSVVNYFCDKFYKKDRCPIIHGEDLHYDNKQNCLKVIALLDYLTSKFRYEFEEKFSELFDKEDFNPKNE